MRIHSARSPYPSPQGGFTLAEVVLGILILSLGIVSFMEAFSSSGFNYVKRARDYAIAVTLCERFLNIGKVELLLSETPVVGEADLKPEIERSETLRQSLESAENIFDLELRRVVSPCPPSSRLYRVTVTMRWAERHGGVRLETVSLGTLVGRKNQE